MRNKSKLLYLPHQALRGLAAAVLTFVGETPWDGNKPYFSFKTPASYTRREMKESVRTFYLSNHTSKQLFHIGCMATSLVNGTALINVSTQIVHSDKSNSDCFSLKRHFILKNELSHSWC